MTHPSAPAPLAHESEPRRGNTSPFPGLALFEVLGRGAHAVVYRAERNGVDYAVKLLSAPMFVEASAITAFRREAALLASVRHPGIAAVHETGQVGDRPYLVMELVRGRTLAEVMAGGVSEQTAVAIAADVAEALGAAHASGLTHRDVKPQNIMVQPDGSAKLIDFGLAARAAVQAIDDTVAGTFAYSAPEQTGMLARMVDGRSDLYSLGVVLFHCVTGRLPFPTADVGELLRQHTVEPAPDVRSLRPELSAPLAALIAKLLAKDPDDRYQTARGLAADLRALAEGTLRTVGDLDGPTDIADAPLVGRSSELAQLTARWSQALAGHGSMTVVAGPPGAGKSRLVREVLATAAVHGKITLRGKCSPDEAVPMGPIRAAVSEYLAGVSRLPGAERDAAHELVRTAAGRGASLLGALAPELAAVLSAPRLADEDRQDQFVVAVASFLAGLADAAGGGILCLDDVQWLDPATRRVLHHLADQLRDTPLLLLATSRDDEPSRRAYEMFQRDYNAPGVVLHPLDDAVMSQIIAGQLGGAELTPELTEALVARSGGNPFTAGEYVRSVIDAGLVRPSWGTWVLEEGGLDALHLPEDVLDLVLARVRGLGTDTRNLLVAAAAAGIRVRAADLAAICGRDEQHVLNVLRLAADRSLLAAEADGGYTFVHDRIREALLADVDEARLRALHLRIATVLEDLHGSDPGYVFTIARHYQFADLHQAPERAYRASLAAGTLALANHVPQQALALLATAEEAAAIGGIRPGIGFHETYGLACVRTGRYADARIQLECALELETVPTRRAVLRGLICESHHSAWEIPESLDAADAALAEFGRALPHSRVLLILSTVVSLLMALAVRWTGIGRGTATGLRREEFRVEAAVLAIASQAAIQGRRMLLQTCMSFRELYPALRIGPGAEYVRAYAHLAAVVKMIGMRRLSTRMFAGVSRVAAELGDPRLVAYADWVDTMVETTLRNADIDRPAVLRRLIDEQGRWLDAQEHIGAVTIMCHDLTQHGHVREARAWYERTLARFDQFKPGPTHQFALVAASIKAILGPVEEATREIEVQRERLLSRPDNRETMCNQIMTALLSAVDQGQLGEPFERAAADLAAARMTPWTVWVQQHQLWAFHAYGRLEQCLIAPPEERAERLAAARDAVRLLRKARTTPINRAHHLVAVAFYHQLTGDQNGALERLERADRLSRLLDAPTLSYEIARVRARALLALGKPELAALHVQTAMFLAVRGGWENRVRAVQTEFGAVTSGTRTGVVGDSIPATVYRRRLDALQQVNLAAATVFEPRELTRVALRETIDIFGAERAFIFLADDTGALVPHQGRDASGADLDELSGYGASLVARAHTAGDPLVVTGTADGEVHGSHSATVHGLRSIMVAPLRLQGRPMGVLYLDSRVAKGIFTHDDADILMAIANQVAVSLETARAARLEVAVQAAGRQRDLAERLRSAMSEVSATLDPDEVLTRLLTAVARALRADAACLLRPAADGYAIAATAGHAVGDGPLDLGADQALADLVTSAAPSLGTGAAPAPDVLPDAQSWLAVPLIARGSVPGLLIVTSSSKDAYDDSDLQVAAALVGQGMTAYENACLFDRVTELATVDSMTGVPNRRHFLSLADAAFARVESPGEEPPSAPLTAIMLDIDHFKEINDRYGHLVGDAVIEEVGARLRSALREGDLVGRYGGEEFAVVVAAEPQRAEELAQRLCRTVAASVVITSAGPVPVTVSVGATRRRPDDADLGMLLGRADKALYQAKQRGRNRVATV